MNHLENHYLYNTIITTTITNRTFHSILFIIEYVLGFFSHVSSSLKKVKTSSSTFSYSSIEKIFLMTPEKKIKSFFEKEMMLQLKLYNFILFIITLLSIIGYLVLHLCYHSKKPKFVIKFAINILGLFSYRYFTFLIFDSFSYLLFFFYNAENKLKYFFICINVCLQIIFSVINIYFLSEYTFYCKIKNTLIAKEKIEYPFDYFSEVFEKFLFFLKIIIAYESNYLFYNNYLCDNISLFLNYIIIGYSVIIFCVVYFYYFKNNFLFRQINSDIGLVMINKILITFNFFLLVFQFFQEANQPLYLEISNIILNVFISIVVIFMKWIYFERKFITNYLDEANSDLIICLFTQELNAEVHEKKIHFFTQNFDNLSRSFFDKLTSYMKLNHLFSCDGENCSLCQKGKKNYSYKQLFHMYNKSIRKIPNEIYKYELIHFLYSCIKKNVFGINACYYKLNYNIKNVPKSVKNSVRFIYFNIINQAKNSSSFYLENSIKLCSFNDNLKENLKEFKEIINQNIDYQKGDKILKISQKMYKQKEKYLFLYNDIEEKAPISVIKIYCSKEEQPVAPKRNQISNTIQSIYKYNSIIIRFIIESLLNEELNKLPLMNFEIFEEFLSSHFENVNFLVLSISMGESEENLFKILKSTCFNGYKKKYLSEFFPKYFRKEGTAKLLDYIKHTKTSSSLNFEYFIEINHFYEHFLLNFELSHSFVDYSIIIFGFCPSIYQHTIFLYKEGKSLIYIQGISQGLSKEILITPEVLKCLKKKFNKNLPFQAFFKCVRLIDSNNLSSIIGKVNDREKKERQNKNTFNNISKIKCLLNYDCLYKTLKKNVEAQLDQNSLLHIQSKLEAMKGEKINLIFEKLFQVGLNFAFFKCNFEKGTFSKKAVIRLSSNQSLKQNNITKNEIPQYFEKNINNINMFASSISITENSFDSCVMSFHGESRNKKKSSFQFSFIKKEEKTINLLSTLTFVLIFILIFLCFLFLFKEISQANILSEINSFSFSFKSLRHNFITVLYSTLSLTCIESDKSKEEEECKNKFIDFMVDYQKKLDFNDYSIIDYFWYELKHKVNDLKTFYNELQRKTSTKDFNKFKFMFINEMKYFYIKRENENFFEESEMISFEVGIERTINSIFLLIDESNKEKEYIQIPYYIISKKGEFYDLSKIKLDYFHFQNEMFKLFANFINFFVNFNLSDKSITQYFESVKSQNIAFTISFMIMFIILNSIILLINLENLKFSKILFTKLIFHSLSKIENIEFKNYLNKKLKNLIILSELYSVNPVDISHKILQEQQIYLFKDRKKIKENQLLQQLNTNSQKKEHFKDFSYQMKDFTKEHIIPLYKKNFLLYLLYLTVIGGYDLLLIFLIFQVYSFKAYVELEFDFQSYIYTDISLVHLFRFLNTTEKNIGEMIDYNDNKEGVINYFIRDSLKIYSKVIGGNYPKQSDYFKPECDKFFDSLNDTIFYSFEKNIELPEEKRNSLAKSICKDLKFDEAQYFVYEDYFFLLHQLHNKYSDRTINGMLAILDDQYFYKAYLYLYFYLRPAISKFDLYVLNPIINKKFSDYILYMLIYLLLNISLEILISFLQSLLVHKEFKNDKKFLSLFAQCFIE